MNSKNIIGLTFFCVGLIVLLFALGATQTWLESFFKWFAGYYTEHTMIALISGAALLTIGSLMAFSAKK